MEDTKELKAQPKTEVAAAVEHTTAGQVFNPAVDIFETDKAITLLADMPGVNAERLTIDLHDDTLSLRGEVIAESSQSLSPLVVEYQTGTFQRHFTLPAVIDQAIIEPQMKNGFLRLVLPKVEKASPLKIEVKA